MRTAAERVKHAEYMRNYYATHPASVERKRKADENYRARNWERVLARERARYQDPVRKAYKAAHGKRYRAAHGEQIRKYAHEYYQQHKSKWQARNVSPERVDYQRKYGRWNQLRHKYGIEPEDYVRLFERQGGVCAICVQPPGAKKLHVDHDHATNVIRGLLCTRCNNALERLERYPEWGAAASEYLARLR